MKNLALLARAAALALLLPLAALAQTPGVGIGTTTPNSSAALDVSSTSKGLLPPRMTQAQRDAIASPAAGLTLFNTTTGKLNTWNGTGWAEPLTTTEQPYQNPAVTFTYTAPGGEQIYTVPAGVTSLTVDASGAQGGSGAGASGGRGGRVQTTLAVTPGEVLRLYVGGAGSGTPSSGSGGAGYNGGGLGTATNGGGGGGTDIRRGGAATTDRIVVAGGGGGFAGGGGTGGAGGNLTGAGGGGTYPGGGGTQSAGGAGGFGTGTGAFFQGGTGNFSGGGGGYYGGGGGGKSGSTGGAGGGSSFVTATGSSNTTHTQGYQSGNGILTLTPGPAYATPTFSAANLTNLPAANLTGSVPASSLTSLPAANLTGSVPAATLTSVPAASLTGSVPAAALTSVPAASLTGSVPAASLTSVPAANLTGSIPAASLTSVPAASLTGSVPAAALTSVPAASLTGSVPAASLTSVPAASLTGVVAVANLPVLSSSANGANRTISLGTGNSTTFSVGDNLGSHTATQNLSLGTFSLTGTSAVNVGSNLNLGANQLVGNGGSQGLAVSAGGSVGIGTGGAPDASAALEVRSTTQGLLPPRLTTTQRDAVASPAVGLTVYNTSTGKLNTWNGTTWAEPLTATEQPYQNATATFAYTGAAQSYTVPAGVTSLSVDASGAQGGANNPGRGVGSRVVTTLLVTPGEVLTVLVGGQGSHYGTGGYNGGGAGGSTSYGYGGGGGATDLRRGGSAVGNRIVIAAGGGGGIINGGFPNERGGNGGYPVGGTPNPPDGLFQAQGGTQSAGGAGYTQGAAGTLWQGGAASAGGGGGGGGGYYGGGGSGNGGGGGGSSFVTPSGSSNTSYTTAGNGNGSLTLTPALVYAAPVLDGSNFVNVPGDNLGSHTATQNLSMGTFSLTGTTAVNVAANLNLGANQLVGNGGSSGLRVSSAGQVGIGATPTQVLDVNGGILARANGAISNQGAYLQWNRSGGDGETWLLNQQGGGGGGIRFGSATTANATTEWARFDGSGNLGLGTTAPLTRLSIRQVTSQSSTAGQNLGELSFVGFNRSSPSASVQALTKNFDDTGHLLFKTSPNGGGAVERVRITADGDVGIGISVPTQQLDVDGGILARANGAISAQGAYLQWNRSGGIGETWLINQQGGGPGGIFFGKSDQSNNVTEWARFDASGNLGIGAASPGQRLFVSGTICATGGLNCTSDGRYKQDVTLVQGALASVLRLRGVTYYWKQAEFPEKQFEARRQLGFIAQEIEPLYPEMVTTDADGYKSVDYSRLTPVLVEALKEQQAQIEALKQQAAAAKAEAAATATELQAVKTQATQTTATLESLAQRLRALEAGGGQARK